MLFGMDYSAPRRRHVDPRASPPDRALYLLFRLVMGFIRGRRAAVPSGPYESSPAASPFAVLAADSAALADLAPARRVKRGSM